MIDRGSVSPDFDHYNGILKGILESHKFEENVNTGLIKPNDSGFAAYYNLEDAIVVSNLVTSKQKLGLNAHIDSAQVNIHDRKSHFQLARIKMRTGNAMEIEDIAHFMKALQTGRNSLGIHISPKLIDGVLSIPDAKLLKGKRLNVTLDCLFYGKRKNNTVTPSESNDLETTLQNKGFWFVRGEVRIKKGKMIWDPDITTKLAENFVS